MRGAGAVGRGSILVVALVALPGIAAAQVTGWATVAVGATTGGATTENGTAFAVSTAVFEGLGWFGVELELAHSTRFDDQRFADTDLSTLMLNVIVSPHTGRFQPFVAGGVGAIRARGCLTSCTSRLSRTEFGVDVGGGLRVPVTELFAVQVDGRYFRRLSGEDDLPGGGVSDVRLLPLHGWRRVHLAVHLARASLAGGRDAGPLVARGPTHADDRAVATVPAPRGSLPSRRTLRRH